MVKYILKRILWMIPVLLGVIVSIFTLLSFTRGDPAAVFAGTDPTPDQMEIWREEHGLNDPYFVRLINYLKQLVIDRNLGTSYQTGLSVSGEIWQRFKVTALLASLCVVFEVLFGVGMGVLASTHQNTPLDRISMSAALIGASVPGFAVALIFSLIFALKLGWFPANGWGGAKYLVLPVLSNVIAGSSGFARQTRSSMLEVIRSDYVTTARAKGISGAKVVFKHELKSALIPIITIVGQNFGRALGGTVVMEQVFSIPGLGNYMVQAINARNYPVVQGSVLFLSLAFAIVMLFVDILYAIVDPRIRVRFLSVKKQRRAKEG